MLAIVLLMVQLDGIALRLNDNDTGFDEVLEITNINCDECLPYERNTWSYELGERRYKFINDYKVVGSR